MEQLEKYIEGARRGNVSDFEKVIELKRNHILYFATYLSDGNDGEDIAQEASFRMFKSINNLKAPELFDAWMKSVVRYTYMDYKRLKNNASSSIQEPVDFSEGKFTETMIEERAEFLPINYAESSEDREMVMRAVKSLPIEQKLCIYHFYAEGKTYKEISEMLEIDVKKVDNNLVQARKKLKSELKRETGNTFLFGIAPIAGIPTLTKIFEMDMESSVTPEMGARLIENLHMRILHAGSAGGAAAGVGGTSAAVTGGGKVLVISLAAIAVAAGIAIGINNKEEKPELGTETAAVIEEIPEEIVAEQPESELESTVVEILTVADMIGEEAAQRLEEMIESGIQADEAEIFVEEIGAVGYETASGIDNSHYITYVLEKQDKRLTLIVRVTGENVHVKYTFGSREVPVPMMDEMIFLLETQ